MGSDIVFRHTNPIIARMEGDTTQIPEQKLHAWGSDLKEAFEQVAMAMFAYMTTNYDSVDMTSSYEIDATGSDMKSLLFHFLDEWLFAFSAGDFFFPRGTEVKAITYSNMQIYDEEKRHEVFVIIDI
ncbi:unnamed protein product [Mesocestoides corti]|uniref:Archease domain-containing protein n=1 Tax=Mesocestoides corti TaxID=53468 RepID=A0A0R3UNH4_MESCO|nr:unnamed protein product [Mesocestoides corti]